MILSQVLSIAAPLALTGLTIAMGAPLARTARNRTGDASLVTAILGFSFAPPRPPDDDPGGSGGGTTAQPHAHPRGYHTDNRASPAESDDVLVRPQRVRRAVG
jgi:hypothetical protein